MKAVSAVVLFGLGIATGNLIATDPPEPGTPEVVYITLADDCEPTYGPLPIPMDGWRAWGFRCPVEVVFP